jgi:signal transduction histidine kinase
MDAAEWSSLGLQPLSRVRLDELLQELLDRVAEIMASRERLRSLLDAVVAVGSDLDLPSTLERIVVAACQLTNAQYGALGVLGADDKLVQFITHGIDPRQHALIGDLPTGHGVLGLLISDPRPVRVPDITAHPRSIGFPPNHPPMHSFLGVPIRIRDQVFGNLYLAQKRDAAEFTDDDEQISIALAGAAGTAIENARLYELAQRRQRWLAATAEIITVLSEETRTGHALALVAQRAREVADAALVIVLLPGDTPGTLIVAVVDAEEPVEGLAGSVIEIAGTELEPVVSQRLHVSVDHLGKAAVWPVAVPELRAVAAGIAAGQGILLVAYRGRARDADELPLLAAFAAQAGLALERASAREDREQLLVLSDRERIARDLHDVVIQRLFATGMQLQTIAGMKPKPEIEERVNVAVDELDRTIRDIRGTIFQLRSPVGTSLRAQVRALTDDARGGLGFTPQLLLDGPVDTAVPEVLRAHVVAVISEGLSNVARHARASAVTVTVHATGEQLTITIADDGIGGAAEHGGLINLRERAERHGGHFTIAAREPAGTTLTWQVPL